MHLAELRTIALALKPDERENLAYALLDSLADEPVDMDQAWLSEVDRRMDEVEAGRIDMIAYDQFRAEIREKIGW